MTRVLLPGRILRHIADVGAPGPFQRATWYPLTRLCDRSMRLAGDQFITQHCEDGGWEGIAPLSLISGGYSTMFLCLWSLEF